MADDPEPIGIGIVVAKLADSIWVFTSMRTFNGVPIPANGLLVRTADGVVMLDTPWNDDETTRLLGWIDRTLKLPVLRVLVTHSHADRMGGIRAILRSRIQICATPLTIQQVDSSLYPKPSPCLASDTTLTIGGTRFETYYPGPGHAPDNIVIWLPDRKLLYGGCLVKSSDATTLGLVSGVDVKGWATAIRRVTERYGTAVTVVPGHGGVGGVELLRHTADLIRQAQETVSPGR